MENDDAVSQDKVLIERDGHFELVSTSDVQAETMADLLTEEQPHEDNILSTSDTIVPQNVKDPIKVDETPNNDDKEGITTQAPLINITNNPADTNYPPKPTNITTELLTVSSSTLAMKGNNPPLARRSISAPPGQHSRHLVKAEQERATLNERAFQIWLEKKNSELTKKRELERLSKKEEESQEEKEERNRKAFTHWLARKQRQMSAIRSSTKDCNIDQEEDRKIKKDEAFKIWIQRKSEEKQKLIELEKQRQKELDETAKRIDSKIAQTAYKE